MEAHRAGVPLAFLAPILFATTLDAAQYSLIPIPFRPTAINSSGQIVGNAWSGGVFHAYTWIPDGTGGGATTSLVPITTSFSEEALALNASGQAAGDSHATLGSYWWAPQLWTPTSTGYSATTLPDPSPLGSETIYAYGINDAGQVVGSGYDFYGGVYRSFLWTPLVSNGTSGSMSSLPATNPKAINASGEVVGGSNGAFLWKPTTPNGTFGTLFPLGGLPGGGGSGYATAINTSGLIVGTSSVGTTNHAFLWTPIVTNGTSGSMIDLGDLPGDTDESLAYAINSAGVVVGRTGDIANGDSSNRGTAFVWTHDGGMQDLNSLVDASAAGWALRHATGINDRGWIVGTGTDPAGTYLQGFLLIPTPEPASLAVLALGAALFQRRRGTRLKSIRHNRRSSANSVWSRT